MFGYEVYGSWIANLIFGSSFDLVFHQNEKPGNNVITVALLNF